MERHLGGHMNVTHTDEGSLKALIDICGNGDVEGFLDIGCGPGGMLRLAKQYGIKNVVGIDGDSSLKYDSDLHVEILDFTKEHFSTRDRYSIGWSVEFVEHVEAKYINNFMPAFRACSLVLLTAAPPGTPGHHHVNCQHADYWIDIFAKHHLIYNEQYTETVRHCSTMKRDFVRRNGLVFVNRRES